MDVEVTNFLGSLGTNLKKADLIEKADFLTAADPEWIVTLQTQLSQEHWVDCSLDEQLSMLYVLNAYFKSAFGKTDLTNWIGVLEKMVDTLHISSAQHEKETKHVLKLVNIWAIPIKPKEVNGRKASAKYSSIFPRDICDAWVAKLKQQALTCGIMLSEAPINADPDMAPSVSVGTFDKQLSLMNPNNVQPPDLAALSRQDTSVAAGVATRAPQNNGDTAAQEPVVYSVNFIRHTEDNMQSIRALTAREKLKGAGTSSQRSIASAGACSSSSSSSNKGSQHSSSHHRSNANTGTSTGAGASFGKPTTTERPAGRFINVVDEMQQGVVRAMCLFQAQIFKHFLDTQPKRLDRWNMNIVMLSSYYLLHMYVAEKGTCEVDSAALVVACIYLAGKAEYLFVKADRLRSVANRFVRVLNEAQMLNNLQIYKYEAELLRMLQYDVGMISNPLRCLKALDIVEARSQGQILEPSSSSAVASTTATATTATASINTIAAPMLALTAANLSAATSSASTATGSATPQPVSQNRRLLDQAAAVFLAEQFLFSADMLHVSSDFYLAAIVLLEKTHIKYSDDEHECRIKYGTFLCDLNQLSAGIRRGDRLSTACSAPGNQQLSFLEMMAAMRSQEGLDSLREEGEISSSSEDSSAENPIFPVSPRCVELVLECLNKIEKVEADKKTAQVEQDRARLKAEAARLAAAKAVSDAFHSKQSRKDSEVTTGRRDHRDDPRERGVDRDPSRGRHEDRYERRAAASSSRYTTTSRDVPRDDSHSRHTHDRGHSRDGSWDRERNRGRSPEEDARGQKRSRGASRSPSRDRRLADQWDQHHPGRNWSPDRRYRERSEERPQQRGDRQSRERRSTDQEQEHGYGRTSRDRSDQDYRSDRRDQYTSREGFAPGGSRYTSRSPSRDYGAVSAPITAAPSRGRSRDRGRHVEQAESDRRQDRSRERRDNKRDRKRQKRSRSPDASFRGHPAGTDGTGDRRRRHNDTGDDHRVDQRGISGPAVTAASRDVEQEPTARTPKRPRIEHNKEKVLEEGEQAEEAGPSGGVYCQDVSLAAQYPCNVAYVWPAQQQSPMQLPQPLAVPPPLARATEAGDATGVWFSDMSPAQRPTTVEVVGETSPITIPSQTSAVDLTNLPSSSTHQVVYSLADTDTSSAPLRSTVAPTNGARTSPRNGRTAITTATSPRAVPADDATDAMEVIEVGSSAESIVECIAEIEAVISAAGKTEHMPVAIISTEVQETQPPTVFLQPSEAAMDVSDPVSTAVVVRAVPASYLKRARSASSASAASSGSSAGSSNSEAGGSSVAASSPTRSVISATSSQRTDKATGVPPAATSPVSSSAVSVKTSPSASAASMAVASNTSSVATVGKVVSITSGGSLAEQMSKRAAKFASPAVPSSGVSNQSAPHPPAINAKTAGNQNSGGNNGDDRRSEQHRSRGEGHGGSAKQHSRGNSNSNNQSRSGAQMRTERDPHRDKRQGTHNVVPSTTACSSVDDHEKSGAERRRSTNQDSYLSLLSQANTNTHTIVEPTAEQTNPRKRRELEMLVSTLKDGSNARTHSGNIPFSSSPRFSQSQPPHGGREASAQLPGLNNLLNIKRFLQSAASSHK